MEALEERAGLSLSCCLWRKGHAGSRGRSLQAAEWTRETAGPGSSPLGHATLSPQTSGHSGPCLLTSFLYREQGGSLSSLGWARLGQWRQPRNKESLVPAQGRCPSHPNDLLGQPLVNEGRVRGTAPWASVGRSHPTAQPEGTLGSVALETRALWRSCWLEKLAATRLRLPPPPSRRHINPAVPRVQPGWSAHVSVLWPNSCTAPPSSLGIPDSQSHPKL